MLQCASFKGMSSRAQDIHNGLKRPTNVLWHSSLVTFTTHVPLRRRNKSSRVSVANVLWTTRYSFEWSTLQHTATHSTESVLSMQSAPKQVLLLATFCCSVLQCVAVCCRVLQCVAVCCSVLQCAAVWCSVLQCVAVCCSVLQCFLDRICQCKARPNIHVLCMPRHSLRLDNVFHRQCRVSTNV